MEPAHLQRLFQGRYGRPRKMQRGGQKKSTRQVGQPFQHERQPWHPQAAIQSQVLAGTGAVKQLVARQQFVHPARAEPEAVTKIGQAGLVKMRDISCHRRRLAGKRHGGEKHGQLPVGIAHLIGEDMQRPGVLDAAGERHELVPTESPAQRHQIHQHLLQRLRTCAAIGGRGQLENVVAQTRRQPSFLHQQPASYHRHIKGLAGSRLRRREQGGAGQRAAAQQLLHGGTGCGAQEVQRSLPVFLPDDEFGERFRQRGFIPEKTLQRGVVAPCEPVGMLPHRIGHGQAKIFPAGNSLRLRRL